MHIPKSVKGRGIPRLSLFLMLALAMGLIGCDGSRGEAGNGLDATDEAKAVRLGPVDGLNLPSVDLERVAVGSPAPDFSLQTISGDTLTLSSFRGDRNVVLVFYRGHW